MSVRTALRFLRKIVFLRSSFIVPRASMSSKRKAKDSAPAQAPAAKKPATDASQDDRYSPQAHLAEKYGIVQRKYYPPEMSTERCHMYTDGRLPRPYDLLDKAIKETAKKREDVAVGEAVVHWFKRDLRLSDNKPLSLASELARKNGVPLICLFVVSPQDYEAHLTCKPRVDFELRTLEVIKDDLDMLNIPLVVDVVDKRKTIPGHVVGLCKTWKANHVFCGIEYEVDELRRDTLLVNKCLEEGIAFNPQHDDPIVPPGAISTGAGKQFAVYSPYYRAWVAHVHKHDDLLKEYTKPAGNPEKSKAKFADLFKGKIPSAPESKRLSDEDRTRFANLWPAGEHEARERLDKFLAEKIDKYKDARNYPAANSTSSLSPHFAVGSLSARTAVRSARQANSVAKLDGGSGGISGWISEIVWRDFYTAVLAHWPYVCMNKCFKPEYTNIEWEYDLPNFEKWCSGNTGFPIVDAAMRQANYTGWMHNRCRMIVASFLAKDLMIDWRMGERWFMEHLIDGAFANNSGGWGFSSSTGVDPQPYFRIFNPLLQSEKFDASGDYIRQWVPELSELTGKEVHDPYGRGAGKAAEKKGYPRPIVDHKQSRGRALARFKSGLGRETA